MYVELKNINKNFGDYKASDNVNFGVEKGKLIGLLGPSGSGKTTILRMIAGLETPDSGDIIIDGVRVNDLAASKRGIGFVFQNYVLFRYMTVYDNIAFGLRVQKADKKKIDERVRELIKLIGLEGLEKRYPSQLSGGQRQRVAFARALAPNPQLLLLDEPFAEEQYAICISKENHELTEKIDKALAELKDEGVLDKIKSYYIEGNTDTVPYESPKDIKYDGELHMATNAAFPPYEYVEGGEIVGLDPMMATAICDKLGKKLVIDDMEFDSVITAVQTGKDDFGMAGMTDTPERRKNIDFSTSYANTTQVIIVNDSASGSLFGNLGESFKNTFITDNRWQQLLSGLLVTLEITLFAGIIGVIIGFVIALVRATHDIQLDKRKCRSFGDCVLKFFNAICNIYITVIRGTPVVVQLMIMYYIILASVRNGIFAAIIAFGMNSAAYVAEIVRSGIMAVDIGQTEASRSLGFNNRQTMTMVVLPQAIKNVLPALGNEIITLLKETSVAGYVALADITYIGNMIRSRTYEAFFPLITVALIYLVIVLVLSYILRRFERRLKKSER